MNARPGLQPVRAHRVGARDQQGGRRVGDLRRHCRGEAAALDERAQRPDLVEVGFAWPLVERQPVQRLDLPLEASFGARPQRAHVRLDRELLHVVA